jgi:hypothetical protein
MGCSSLEEIELPDSVRAIAYDAFSGCTSLKAVTIPANVQSIAEYSPGQAFASCDEDLIIYGYDGTYAETYATENGYTFESLGSYDGTIYSINSFGDGLYWTFADGTLEIFRGDGYGYCSDFSSEEDVPWKDLKEQIEKVEIETGLDRIPAYAFSGCSNLSEIAFMGKVYNIGKSAFQDCTSLTKVTLQDGLSYVDRSAFQGCTSLTSIEFPDTIKTIERYAFAGCTALQTVKMEGTESLDIYSGAFSGCTALTDVYCGEVNWVGTTSYYGVWDKETQQTGSELVPCAFANVPQVNIHMSEYSADDELAWSVWYHACYDYGACNITWLIPDGNGGEKVVPVKNPDISQEDRDNAVDVKLGETATVPLTVSESYDDTSYSTGYVTFTPEESGCYLISTIATDTSNTDWISFYQVEPASVLNEFSFSWYDYAEDGNGPYEMAEFLYCVAGTQYLFGITMPCDDASVDVTIQNNTEWDLDAWDVSTIIGSSTSIYPIIGVEVGKYATRISTNAFGLDELASVTFEVTEGQENISMEYVEESDEWGNTWDQHYEITGLQTGEATIRATVTFFGETKTYEYHVTVQDNQGAYENVHWSLEDGVLTISGEGAVPEGYDTPWHALSNYVTAIKVESGITEIGYGVFDGLYFATALELPDTLVTIGNYAFGWTNIESLKIPEGVTSIGTGAFRSSAVESVELPSTLTTIGDEAFAWCDNLQSITLPASLEKVEFNVFWNCYSLTDIYIEGTPEIPVTTYDGKGDLRNCPFSSLENATVHFAAGTKLSYLRSIVEDHTETGCCAVTWQIDGEWNGITWALSVGNKVKLTISGEGKMPNATANASTLSVRRRAQARTATTYPWAEYQKDVEAVQVDDGITSIADSAFQGFTALEEVTLPETVTTIGSYAFQSCTLLETVELPSQVETISTGAFESCEALKEVNIPNKVETIAAEAFAKTALTTVVVPDSVTTIGENAFDAAKDEDGNSTVKIIANEGSKAATYAEENNIKQYIPVDFDTDGEVTKQDLTGMMGALAGGTARDVNGDGTKDTKDIVAIMKYLANQNKE